MNYLQQLMEERTTLAAALETMAARAAERGTDLTDAETAEATRIQGRCAEIDSRLSVFADAQDGNRQYADLMTRIGAGTQQRQQQEQRTAEYTSPGQGFVASDEFRAYGGHGNSGHFEWQPEDGAADPFEGRAAPPTFLADLVRPANAQFAQPQPTVRYPLFGLVNIETLSGNAFDYVQSVFTDNSAVVAEGAPKPESIYTETLVPGVLENVAHFVRISRQALEDVGRVRSIIDGKLTQGVLKKQHAAIAAALAAATLPTADGAGSLLAGIRVGVATVQDAGYAANAVLLNPADWAVLDVALLNETRNGSQINSQFWGLTPVADSSQPAGTATVGDFETGATLFRRSGVAIYATDSHGDNFIHNVITILGEARSKAIVVEPQAFVEVTAGTAPAAARATASK